MEQLARCFLYFICLIYFKVQHYITSLQQKLEKKTYYTTVYMVIIISYKGAMLAEW